MSAAANISPGYSFARWPASAPVFEPLTISTFLQVPLAARILPGSVCPTLHRVSVVESQRIAPASEGGHAPLSPVAGTIADTGVARLFGGGSAPAAKLEPADPPKDAATWQASDDTAALAGIARTGVSPADWIDQIRAAGVWSARRQSPDLIAQLHQALLRPIDTILCGVLDVDPTACLNAALAAQYPLELVAGVGLLAAVFRAPRALLALDAAIPPSWTAGLRRAGRSNMRIVSLANVYPQADPTLMLYTLLGRRLRPERLPTEQGAILLDAAAAVAVGRVALSGATSISAPLVVRDHLLRQSFFVFAPAGMELADVLRQTRCGSRSSLIRAGDMLRDVRAAPESIVAVGTENVVHVSQMEPLNNPDPCTRCGWCIDACPTRVQPAGVLEAAQRSDIVLADNYGVEACIECGVCSYVCPSRLPLLPAMQSMRRAVRTQA